MIITNNEETNNYQSLPCPRCDMPLDQGVTFKNAKENYKERITFPYMKIGESMHMECYIHHVIDSYLKEKDERVD